MANKKSAVKSNVNQDPTVNLKVYVKLSPEAQVVFNHQRRDQAVSFPAVVATVATMIKGGDSGFTGEQEDDKYIVVLSQDQLAEVFTAAREFQASRPATVETAKEAIVFAENAITFAKTNNSGLDLTEAETKLASAKAELKEKVFGKEKSSSGVDFKSVMEAAYDAANTAKMLVCKHLMVRAASLAKETDTIGELAQVVNDLPNDLDQARKSLVEFIKAARMLRTPPARPANVAKPRNNDGHLRERVGTSFGRTGGYSGRR